MALVDARGFQLSPNIGQQLGQGVEITGELQRQQLLQQQAVADQQKAQAALDKQARLQGILGRLGGGQQPQAPGVQPAQALPQLGQQVTAAQPTQLGAQQVPGAQPAQLGAQQAPQIPFGNPRAMAELAIQFPEEFEKINVNLGLITQQQKDEAAGFSFRLRGTPFAQRAALIDQREASVRARGGDPTNTVSLRGMPEEAQNQALELTQIASLSPEKRQEVATGDRDFGLEQQKFGLDQANIFSQIRERTLTGDQRVKQLDFDKQKLEVRRLEQEETAINNKIKQETNQLKRDELELKLDEKRAQIKQNKLDTQFTVDSSVAAIDDTILTTERLLEGEGLEKAAGISSAFFTTPGSDAANFEAVLETFKSQQFIQEVDKMRGLGALGEKEGQRLVDSAASLSLSMSDPVLRREINRVQAKLKKARAFLEKKFSITPKKEGGGDTNISNRIKAARTAADRDKILQSLTGDDISNMSPEELQILLGQ